jgi:signal transduction histidine kinase
VRITTTLVAVAVVAIFLAVGDVLLVTETRARIEGTIAESAMDRAESLSSLVVTTPESFAVGDSELVAQLVDSNGRVTASDASATGMPAFVDPGLRPGGRAKYRLDEIESGPGGASAFDLDEGPFVVIARGVALGDGNGVLLVAASLDNASEAVGQAIPLLVIGLPVLLAIVGALTWVLTGRALAPVEQMRINAGEISASELHRRLPVPATNDELERLAATLNQMLSRLDNSAQRQRRFVADASHELKSPLSALRAMIDVGEQHPDSPAEARLAADLRPEIERMQRLVDDLLVLAREEENPWAGIQKKIDVELDHVVIAEAELLARHSSVVVNAEMVNPAVVRGDPSRLAQLVRNLTDNAARHASGKVWLELRRNDGKVELLVSDDGPGIPEQEWERVFDRFVRLDDSRSRGAGGSGLGLAVARSIARSHGGELVVIASQHGGATFRARLPG